MLWFLRLVDVYEGNDHWFHLRLVNLIRFFFNQTLQVTWPFYFEMWVFILLFVFNNPPPLHPKLAWINFGYTTGEKCLLYFLNFLLLFLHSAPPPTHTHTHRRTFEILPISRARAKNTSRTGAIDQLVGFARPSAASPAARAPTRSSGSQTKTACPW